MHKKHTTLCKMGIIQSVKDFYLNVVKKGYLHGSIFPSIEVGIGNVYKLFVRYFNQLYEHVFVRGYL